MTALSAPTLAHGGAVASALLGVDALYREESGDGTGLAVLDMSRAGELASEAFGSYGEAATRWRELRRAAAGLPEPDRRVYYEQVAGSTLDFIRWRTAGLDFESRLQGFLHVPPRPAADSELDALRHDMGALLREMGHRGDLAAQCAAWEERWAVPADDVAGVVQELLEAAWVATAERVAPIPADPSDGMRVEAVRGVPYNARCDYSRRTIELNVDPTLTLPGLRHLAVHEGYPGHYLQFKLRETGFRDGTAPADNLLSVVNTASSCVFEGIADAGLAMLGWDETPDDRLQALLTRYRAGIGTGAAWRLHALGWSAEDTADWLRARALVGGEGWVRNRMRFIEAPERAVLIWSYWWGEPSVAPALGRTPVADRPRFVQYLYGRMHSNRTVGMFR